MTRVAYGIAFPASRGILAKAPTPDPIELLFANGENGDWWDGSRLATLWQESGGTTPVSAASDPVGKWSGRVNGNAITQSTGDNRPIISATLDYLTFDGNNDSLRGTFTLAQPCTRISLIQQISYTNGDFILDGATTNACSLAQVGTSPTLRSWAGTGLTTSALSVGTTGVITEIYNGASSKLAVNNGSYTTGNAGSASPGGLTVGWDGGGIGGRANCRIYQVLLIDRVLSDDEIATVRTIFGAKAGLSL